MTPIETKVTPQSTPNSTPGTTPIANTGRKRAKSRGAAPQTPENFQVAFDDHFGGVVSPLHPGRDEKDDGEEDDGEEEGEEGEDEDEEDGDYEDEEDADGEIGEASHDANEWTLQVAMATSLVDADSNGSLAPAEKSLGERRSPCVRARA